jgi:hypothetical protein
VTGTREAFSHCAVRIVNERMDLTFELLGDEGIGRPQTAGPQLDPQKIAAYKGNWVRVAVPRGMSSEEFDEAVFHSAIRTSQEVAGRAYIPSGGVNSNRFVYRVIKEAGGRVPSAATRRRPGSPTPGLCGGHGIFRGTDCQP